MHANGIGVWLECKGTRHQCSGPEAKAGTRLRDRCLDGCYGNRRQSEVLCMSYTCRSQWRGGKWKAGRRRTRGNEKEGWERLNKQLARSKLQTAHVSMTAAREGRSWRASEVTPDRGLLPYINFCQSKIDTKCYHPLFREMSQRLPLLREGRGPERAARYRNSWIIRPVGAPPGNTLMWLFR